MGERLDYRGLLEVLKDALQHEGRGTLFIKSDDGHAIVVAMEDQKIVSVQSGPKRGMEALDALRRISGGSYRFDDQLVIGRSGTCPPTREILDFLSAEAPRSAGDAGDQTGMLASIEDLLSHYVGPIANVLVQNACSVVKEKDVPRRMQLLIKQLASELDDPDEASRFRNEAKQLLS